jgi:4-amino-4-deoxy-L-arabinose transferase-like glycosyltransferase
MNRYWGGAVSAIAGCLVFGALPRIRERFRTRDAVLLGLGIGLQMLTRPFESLFVDLSVVLFFLPELRRAEWAKLMKAAVPALLAAIPCVALLLLHNHAVTGNWTTLPYALSRYQYGVPTTFTFEPNPVPHNTLTAAQQLYYEGQAQVHGGTDSFGGYLDRLGSRAGFYRFFFLAPLLLALPFLVPLLREYRYLWIALTFVLFALGTNFYPYFFAHYLAAETCLFLLVTVLGLMRLSQWRLRDWQGGRLAAVAILVLCATHFLFWYGVHAQGDEQILWSMTQFETAPGINFGDVEGRITVEKRLAAEPGRQLVFVRYFSTHGYQEWIHNDADIDRARVVWALELTPGENAKLKSYYPDRKVWLMEPDAQPPKLLPYPVNNSPFLPVE